MKQRFLILACILLVLSSCLKEEQFNNSKKENFEVLWSIMDQHYCFFDYKKVNWDSIHTVYASRINENMSDDSFFDLMGDMLGSLRDGHVNIISTANMSRYWSFFEDYPPNFDANIQKNYLGTDYMIVSGLEYKILPDNIGYIYDGDFSIALGDGNLNEVISHLSLCTGIIIDVRNNGGGSLTNADMLAAHFFNKKTLVGYILHKTGTGHNDFSPPYPRYITPSSGIFYSKKVVVLTNRSCFSATNDFVNAMTYAPNVTIMGDNTGGGSGLPFSSELPNGWSVRFSASPMLNAAKEQTENGISPTIKVSMTDADAAKGVDTIIETARSFIKIKMKRILIFNDGTTIGGAEILLIDILKHLDHEMCNVTLALPYPSDDRTLYDKIPQSVSIEYLYKQKPTKIKHILYTNLMVFFPHIYNWCINLDFTKFDLIVCFKNSFYSIPFSRIKLPKYVWIHTQPYIRSYENGSLLLLISNTLNKLHLQRMYRCFKYYNHVFCVSNDCKDEFYKHYAPHRLPVNVSVMYNALDLKTIEDKAKQPIDLKKDQRTTFIVIHRFSPEKRQDRMITVANKLLEEGYKFRILMLGKGSEYQRIEKMVIDNRLQESILMLGYIENPYPYFNLSDWLVVCSSIESFSLVLLEATSLNTPIITTDCGGPVDVIDNGKYGILTPNSTDGIYHAMKKVLDEPQLWSYYQSKKEECLARFDYDKWIAKIDDLFLSK